MSCGETKSFARDIRRSQTALNFTSFRSAFEERIYIYIYIFKGFCFKFKVLLHLVLLIHLFLNRLCNLFNFSPFTFVVGCLPFFGDNGFSFFLCIGARESLN